MMNSKAFTPPEIKLAEGEDLAPHEMPMHAELVLADLPKSHGAHSQWEQRGIKLTCTTCPDEHGLFIEPRKMFTGKVNKEGAPILTDRW